MTSSEPTQAVWDGTLDRLGTAYQTHVITWLTANGINPLDVDAISPITTTDTEIRYTRILRDDHGRPFTDTAGQRAKTTEVAAHRTPFQQMETDRA